MEDYAIPLDQEFYIGYAYNPYNSDISYYTKHNLASSVAVKLSSDGSPTFGELVKAEIVDNVGIFDAFFENFGFSDGASMLTQISAIAALISAIHFF